MLHLLQPSNTSPITIESLMKFSDQSDSAPLFDVKLPANYSKCMLVAVYPVYEMISTTRKKCSHQSG